MRSSLRARPREGALYVRLYSVGTLDLDAVLSVLGIELKGAGEMATAR